MDISSKGKLDLSRLEAVVKGYVQGVSFRWYTQKQARSLGLKGYVKNLPNGAVEVIAEGDRDDLRKLLKWLHSGPVTAEVAEVNFSYANYTGRYSTFEIAF